MKTFFWKNTCVCVLNLWPWPQAFLFLASRVSVLGRAVLGLSLVLGFFLCPWPRPRALCPRLHLWYFYIWKAIYLIKITAETWQKPGISNPVTHNLTKLVLKHKCKYDVVIMPLPNFFRKVKIFFPRQSCLTPTQQKRLESITFYISSFKIQKLDLNTPSRTMKLKFCENLKCSLP